MAKWKSPFVDDDDDNGFTTPTPSSYDNYSENPFTHIPQAPHHHKSLFVSHDDGSATPPPAWNYSNNPFTYIPQAPASSKKLLSKRIFLDLDDDDRHLLYAPDLMLFTSSPTRSPTNDDDDSDTTTTTNIKKVKTTHTSSFNKNNTNSSSSTLKFQASLLQLLHGKSLQQQFKNKRDGVMTEIEIGIQIGNGSGISAAAAAIVAAECCDDDDDNDDDALLVGTLNISSSNIDINNNSTPQLLSSESLFKSGGGFPHSKEEEFSSTKIQRSSSGIVALGRVVQRRRSGIARGA